MASTMANGLQKVVDMDGSATKNPKLTDLAKDTYDSHDTKAKMTTDFGQKVSNTDDWLTVSTEDRTGPSLLEDGHGREKVRVYTIDCQTGLYNPDALDTDPPLRSRTYS